MVEIVGGNEKPNPNRPAVKLKLKIQKPYSGPANK